MSNLDKVINEYDSSLSNKSKDGKNIYTIYMHPLINILHIHIYTSHVDKHTKGHNGK